jgi:hypothetical protein
MAGFIVTKKARFRNVHTKRISLALCSFHCILHHSAPLLHTCYRIGVVIGHACMSGAPIKRVFARLGESKMNHMSSTPLLAWTPSLVSTSQVYYRAHFLWLRQIAEDKVH